MKGKSKENKEQSNEKQIVFHLITPNSPYRPNIHVENSGKQMTIEEENLYLRRDRQLREEKMRQKIEMNQRNKDEIERLKRKIQEQEQCIKNQEKEIQELRAMFTQLQSRLDPIQPEIVKVTIPIVHYITGEDYVLNYNDYKFTLSVDGTIEDGHEVVYEKYGSVLYGQQRDLILKLYMDTQNGVYQRKGVDIFQTFIFEKQHEGKSTSFQLSLPDRTSQQVQFTITDQHSFMLENKGLLKSDGSHGNLQILVALQ